MLRKIVKKIYLLTESYVCIETLCFVSMYTLVMSHPILVDPLFNGYLPLLVFFCIYIADIMVVPVINEFFRNINEALHLGNDPKQLLRNAPFPLRVLASFNTPGCSSVTEVWNLSHGYCFEFPQLQHCVKYLRQLEARIPFPGDHVISMGRMLVSGTCAAITLRQVLTCVLLLGFLACFVIALFKGFGGTISGGVRRGKSELEWHPQIWSRCFTHRNLCQLLINWYWLIALSGNLHWTCSCNLLLLVSSAVIPMYVSHYTSRGMGYEPIGFTGALTGMSTLVYATLAFHMNGNTSFLIPQLSGIAIVEISRVLLAREKTGFLSHCWYLPYFNFLMFFLFNPTGG